MKPLLREKVGRWTDGRICACWLRKSGIPELVVRSAFLFRDVCNLARILEGCHHNRLSGFFDINVRTYDGCIVTATETRSANLSLELEHDVSLQLQGNPL